MTSQEQHVLDEFYKNAVMGADATSTILPKADHPDLRQELCKQLEFYQSRKEEIRSQMQQAHVQPVSHPRATKTTTSHPYSPFKHQTSFSPTYPKAK